MPATHRPRAEVLAGLQSVVQAPTRAKPPVVVYPPDDFVRRMRASPYFDMPPDIVRFYVEQQLPENDHVQGLR